MYKALINLSLLGFRDTFLFHDTGSAVTIRNPLSESGE